MTSSFMLVPQKERDNIIKTFRGQNRCDKIILKLQNRKH